MLGVWLEYRTLFGRQSGILLLMLFSGLKLLETRTPPRRRARRVPRLLPGHHQFSLHADDPDRRARHGVGAVPAHRHADRLQRAAARAARQPAHRRPAARARGARRARPVPAVPARARPAVGPAAGRLRRHDRPVRHHEPGQPVEPRAIRRDRLSRRVPGRRRRRTALRYWRGPVLWDFDGRTWTHRAELRWSTSPRRAAGARVYRYEVVLEPHNRHWLFALETAASLPERARMSLRRPDHRRRRRCARACATSSASVVGARAAGGATTAAAAPRAAPAGRLQPARARARRAVARRLGGRRARCWRAPSTFLRAGPLRLHPRAARCSATTRWTTSCSTRAKASASTSRRRSCS